MTVVKIDETFIRTELIFTDLLKRSGPFPRLTLIHNRSEETCEVFLSQSGSNERLTIPPGETSELFVFESGETRVTVTSCGQRVEKTIELDPPRRIEFNLLMFSHVDLGYTATISEVEELQARYSSTAIDYHRKTLEFPEESRFRWNIETTWALSCFDKKASKSESERIRDLLRSGEFGIGALYLHHYADRTEFEELFHSLRKARSLKAEGIEVRSAFLSDVPGMSTGLLELLANIGVENLFMSINNFVAPFKEFTNLRSPFFWRLPGGRRVLVWITDDPKWAYIEGYRFFESDLANLRREILAKLTELAGRNYRRSVYAIPMAIDNREPVFTPVKMIEEWNRAWTNPIITTATINGFFDRLRPFCADLEEAEGEFNGWWTSNILAYPRENALSSKVFSRLHEASLLNFISNGDCLEEIQSNFEKLSGFDEHSGGGGLYLSNDPEKILEAVSQGFEWVFQASRGADDTLKTLRERVFGSGELVTVLNPTGQTRNDFCVMGCDDPDLRLFKGDGTEAPSLFYDGNLYFDPGKLVAFEHRSFLAERVSKEKPDTSLSEGDFEISTPDFDLSFNDRGELVSAISKRDNIEIVSPVSTVGRMKIARQPVNPAVNLADAVNHEELYTGKVPAGLIEDYLSLKCGHRVFESSWGVAVEFEPIDRYCRPFKKTYLLPAGRGEIILKVRFNYIYAVGPSDFVFLEIPLDAENPEVCYSSPGRIARLEELISGSGTDALTVLGALRIEGSDGHSFNIGMEGVNLVDFESPSPLGFRRFLPNSGRLYFRLLSGNLQNRFASPYLNGEPLDFTVRLSGGSLELCEYSSIVRHPLSAFRSGAKSTSARLTEIRASENVELFFGSDSSNNAAVFAKEVSGKRGHVFTGEGKDYTLEPFGFISISEQPEGSI